MNKITKAENQLFRRWKKRERDAGKNGFYSDGIPFPEDYAASKIKTVVFLREPHFAEKDRHCDFDLREQLQKEERQKPSGTSWSVTRLGAWCSGMTNYKQSVNESSFRQRKYSLEDLHPFAFMQLKKVPGGNCSHPKELTDFAQHDCEFIRKQLSIYEPHIIVACGISGKSTFQLLFDEIFTKPTKERLEIKQVNRTWAYAEITDAAIAPHPFYLLEAHHPSARGNKFVEFNELVSNYRTIIKKHGLEQSRRKSKVK